MFRFKGSLLFSTCPDTNRFGRWNPLCKADFQGQTVSSRRVATLSNCQPIHRQYEPLLRSAPRLNPCTGSSDWGGVLAGLCVVLQKGFRWSKTGNIPMNQPTHQLVNIFEKIQQPTIIRLKALLLLEKVPETYKPRVKRWKTRSVNRDALQRALEEAGKESLEDTVDGRNPAPFDR